MFAAVVRTTTTHLQVVLEVVLFPPHIFSIFRNSNFATQLEWNPRSKTPKMCDDLPTNAFKNSSLFPTFYRVFGFLRSDTDYVGVGVGMQKRIHSTHTNTVVYVRTVYVYTYICMCYRNIIIYSSSAIWNQL